MAVAASLLGAIAAEGALAANGDLTQKQGAGGCVAESGGEGCADGTALEGARSVAVSPDGTSVYVVSTISDAVVVFDRAPDGTFTQKSELAGCVSETGSAGACVDGRALEESLAVALSPDGENVYVASYQLHSAVAVFDREIPPGPPSPPDAGIAARKPAAGLAT